jgi:hypothetical protein
MFKTIGTAPVRNYEFGYSCDAMTQISKQNGLEIILESGKQRHQSRQLKKLTCKSTLRQVFLRIYGLEIQSVMLVFSTQLCKLLIAPLTLSLVQISPLPCVNKYTVYT